MLALHNFDLVVTDLIMPEKEGIELIYGMNKNFPDMKIVAITGGGQDTSQKLNLENAALLGADATLQKPFSLTALLATVDDCLSANRDGRKV